MRWPGGSDDGAGRALMEPRESGSHGRLLFIAANPSIDRQYELDRLAIGTIHRPRLVVAVPGGKGLNAARSAVALGASVTAVAIVGGRAGDWIVERLAELGVDVRTARTAAETRTCVSILDRSSGATTEIYEHGDAIDAAAWAGLEGIVETELATSDVAAVAISGSLPIGAPQDGYARIARIAAAGRRHVPILADSYGPALAALLAEGPAVVKVNAAEASEASGRLVSDPASAIDAADVLRDKGAGAVVVTLGVDGAIVVSDEGRTRLLPPTLRGAYPVGSGDAVLGGVAVAWARGDSVVDAARLGLAAGIANAQVPGAGVLDANAIDAILERIRQTSS